MNSYDFFSKVQRRNRSTPHCWSKHILTSSPPSPQVNGINLREASHDEAINVLRQTPQRVRLVVYRDEAQYKEEDLWDSFTVELHKKPGQGLGLSIVGRR